VPVLLMSGFSETEAMNRSCGQAASNFLAKPFQPEELREKMQAILTRDDLPEGGPDFVTSISELDARKSGAV
jgi:DNA-binding response OmpR family regulator